MVIKPIYQTQVCKYRVHSVQSKEYRVHTVQSTDPGTDLIINIRLKSARVHSVQSTVQNADTDTYRVQIQIQSTTYLEYKVR